MKNVRQLLQIAVCLALLGACSTTYEPHLALPAKEVTRSIDANVEVHPFVASDDLVSGHSPYGVRADDYVNKPPSELTQALTREVIAELSGRRVFRKVSTYDPASDFILTGRIEDPQDRERRSIASSPGRGPKALKVDWRSSSRAVATSRCAARAGDRRATCISSSTGRPAG